MKDCMKFAAAILFLSASSVAAFAANESGETVTVHGTYVVKKLESRGLTATDNGSNMTVSRDVSYRDLDLDSPDGRAALEVRLTQMATDVCKERERRFPSGAFVPVYADRGCVRNAVDKAMAQIRGTESTGDRLARNH